MIAMASLAQIGDWIMTPFYWIISSVMIFFHWLVTPVFGTSNAGQGWAWFVAIIFMTCVIRLLILPLYAKQMNSQRAMTALQPKMKELQKKYAGDRQRQSAETMKLYQEAGVSPYASCLPMIVQMPLLFGVFWVIRGVAVGTSALRGMFTLHQYQVTDPQTGQLLMTTDLKQQFENATFFGAKLSETFSGKVSSTGVLEMGWPAHFGGTQVLTIVLVLLMMATLFYQQWYMMKRNMPPSALEGPMGQSQKMMLYVFPFMYLFSGMAVPVGVLIYWLTSNVWTMGQQYVMVRMYPTPGTPAYAEWEDRMIAQGKDPVEIERARADKARSKNGGRLTAKMAEIAQQQQGALAAKTDSGSSKSTPVSQAVTRTDPVSGKKVVVRQQPHNISRAKRKH